MILPDDVTDSASLPLVSDREGVAQHGGTRVRVVGVYQELDVRKKHTKPPVYAGHVAIKLADTVVSVQPVWHEHAKRPKEEIARFKGQRVVAVGFLWRTMPAGPNRGASPAWPTMRPEALREDR